MLCKHNFPTVHFQPMSVGSFKNVWVEGSSCPSLGKDWIWTLQAGFYHMYWIESVLDYQHHFESDLSFLLPVSCFLPSLAARVLWRIQKDTGLVSDSQLLSVDQLEDHVADLSEEDLRKLNTDVHSFLQYWSCGKKQHSTDYISKILSIVSFVV